jgi:hypothetical protein
MLLGRLIDKGDQSLSITRCLIDELCLEYLDVGAMGVRGLAQYAEEDSEFLQSKREGVADAKAIHETIGDLEYSLKLFINAVSNEERCSRSFWISVILTIATP